jgi:uncharacterized protein
MLTRLLVLVLVVAIVMVVTRRARRRVEPPPRASSVQTKTLRCAHCAVYFPQGEAVMRGGRSYCSHAHADRAHAKA